MNRQHVLGMVGAALLALVGVRGDGGELKVKAASACCCGDTCCCGDACKVACCCGPACCGATCCCDTTAAKKAKSCCEQENKTTAHVTGVKAAKKSCCAKTDAR